MIEIIQAETHEQIEEIRKLFREYENWLGIDLCFQDFEKELANLPGKYAKPDGRLFLIYQENQSAGCIALRKIDARTCEMKRLYARDRFRGLGFGKMLIEKLFEEAQVIGYEKMRLDTLPDKMPSAVKLYKSYGFCEIPPYYDNPHRETLFMELDLNS
jgi:ribosomal protein S18 acetylase RimI-like enzyme